MDKVSNQYLEQVFRKFRIPLNVVEPGPYINTLRQSMSKAYKYDPAAFHYNFQFPGVSRDKADALVADATRERRNILTDLKVPIVDRMENWKLPVPLAVYADGTSLHPGRDTTETVLNTIPGNGYGTLRRRAIETNEKSRYLGFADKLKRFWNNWRAASSGGSYVPTDRETAADKAVQDWKASADTLDKFREEYRNKIEFPDLNWEQKDWAYTRADIGQIMMDTPAAYPGYSAAMMPGTYTSVLQHEASHRNTPVVRRKLSDNVNPNRVTGSVPGSLKSPTRGQFTDNWGHERPDTYPTAEETASGIGQLRRLQYNATGKLTRGWNEYLKEEMRRGTIYKGRNGRLYYREGKMFGSSNPAGISADQSGIYDLLEADNNFRVELDNLQRGTPEWKKTFVRYAIYKANRDRLFRTAY